MSKSFVKVGKTAYRFIQGIETVNRTNEDFTIQLVSVDDAIKDKEFVARLINKNSPLIEEVPDLALAKGTDELQLFQDEIITLKAEIIIIKSELENAITELAKFNISPVNPE